jgi:hypothetical protein
VISVPIAKIDAFIGMILTCRVIQIYCALE